MDERDKPHVGERIEPAGRQKAPGRLELVQRFLNTLIHDFDIDRLATGELAAAWLVEKGLIEPGTSVSEPEAARLRRLREGLRALAAANHDGALSPAPIAAIERSTRRALLQVEVDPGGATRLGPAGHGVDAAAAVILGIVHEAQLAGDWRRMKACRQCTYVFFDRSKNRSAAWCSMAICGNRTKNRAYRRRLAVTGPTRRSS